MNYEINELIEMFKKNAIEDVEGGINFLDGYFSKGWSYEGDEWNNHMTKAQKEVFVKRVLNYINK